MPRPLPVPDLGPQPVPGPVPRPVARLLLPAVLPVVVGVLLCAPAAPAGAASAGSLSFTPARGTGASAVTLTTSARCPGGTNVLGRIYGAGFPAEGQVAVANTPISALSPSVTGGYRVPLAMSIQDLLNLQGRSAAPTGRYRLVLTCRMPFQPASRGDFTGELAFDRNHRFTGKAAPAEPAAAPGDGDGPGAAPRATPSGRNTAPGARSQDPTATATNAPQLTAHATDGGLDVITAGLLGVGAVAALAGGTVLWRRRRVGAH